MKSKPVLTADDVKKMLAAAEAHALAHRWAVTIAIADDGGHLLGMLRLDDAAPVSAHIGPAKARTAALGRRETRIYEEIINNGRYAFLSAPLIDGMLEGGLPIVVDGEVVGGIGVSGVKSSEDAEIARAGLAALGL
ncbi:heme-binding protein [Bordetella sp. 2513F-2]